MKIYVVMLYDYSNTACGGAFLEKEKASAVARAGKGSVEEYDSEIELSPEEARYLRPGFAEWQVTMTMGGQRATAEEMWERTPRDVVTISVHFDEFRTTCSAASAEAAIKIANDRRTRWLASGGWEAPGGVPTSTGHSWWKRWTVL